MIIKNDNFKYTKWASGGVNSRDFVERLETSRKVVFSFSDLAKILGKGEKYAKVYVNRLTKKGLLRLERDKYTTVGANPFLVASNLVFPSYVSFISAYSYHNLTTQLPRTLYVVALRQRKGLVYDNTSIRFVRFNKDRFFGFRRETLENKFLFVAEVEKAIVDGLYLPRYCTVAETLFALKDAKLDVEKLLAFTERMRSLALVKRLGFLLEVAGLDVPERWRLSLKNYTLLNPTLPQRGERNERWKLIINEVFD